MINQFILNFTLFCFKVTIKESTTLSDPQGVASLDIERLQGSEGVVNVQWRLNAEAAYDFVEPLTDTVMFSQVSRNHRHYDYKLYVTHQVKTLLIFNILRK